MGEIPTFGGFKDGTFDIEQAITLHPDVMIMNIESKQATEDSQYIEKLAAEICADVTNDIYRPRGIATVPNKEQAKEIIDQLKRLKASPARKRGVTEKEVPQAERSAFHAA